MLKGVRSVFIVCLMIMGGIICLQLFWLKNFYELNKDRFEKEVNFAFEDAVKKEFTIRNDSIEQLLFRFLMDTAEIRITSKPNPHDGRQMYQVINIKDTADYYSFSRQELDFPIYSQQDTNKAKVAMAAAKLQREEDLDHHIIFYRTQNLGKYLYDKADKLSFDTGRLRPVLHETLRQREIYEDFVFALKDQDNTLNRNHFADTITKKFPVITKAFPTYRNKSGENFVRALFPSPTNYLASRTIGVLAASAVLLLIVSFAFFYLIRMINRAKKLSAIKNDFINNITHEFKTPIATVYSAVQALGEFNMAEDPGRAKKYLQISKLELERLSELVTKVLHISLYERPDFQMKIETVDMNRIIMEVLHVQSHSTGKKVNIQYNNQSASSMVKGDVTHLYNSVGNLVDNAIKYSMDEANLVISLSDSDGYAILSVEDNGRGIKKEHQELIFDKFYRVPHNGHPSPKGFGLGLSYTKEVITKHKGWFKVESEFGKGSIFTIALPLAHEK